MRTNHHSRRPVSTSPLQSAIRRALLSGLALTACFAQAADSTWTFNGNGNWNTPANWSAGEPTNNTFNAIIDDGDTAVTVTLNVTRTINNLTLGGDDTLSLGNNLSLTVEGDILNNGVIALQSLGNLTDLILGGATPDLTLSGAGSLRLGANADNRVVGSGTLTNTATHTISGGGQLGVSSIGIANAGLIDANLNAVLMTLDPSGLGLTNTGTLQASNGGILVFTGSGGGAFTNTGGTIQALAGSEVRLVTNAAITGGTLTTAGTGVIAVQASNVASLASATNVGSLVVRNNSTLNLAGAVVNNGTISLNSLGNNTDLAIVDGTMFSGTGSVLLGANADNRVVGSGTLTNTATHTISGGGQLGASAIGIANAGLIDANLSGVAMTLDPSGLGLTNTGTLQASNGGILVFTGSGGGAFTNTVGTIQALAGSEVRLTSFAAITGGTLTTAGSGVIRANAGQNVFLANLTNAGAFLVENNTFVHTAGTITNTGSFTLNSAGNNTDLRVSAATILTGGGTVTLAQNNASRIAESNSGFRFTNVNNLIQGRGQIGANSIAVTNQATIDANVNVPGATLTLDPIPEAAVADAGPSFRNTGTLQASNGGVLIFTGSGGGAFTNTGGTIQALAGSEVRLVANAAITGGTLTTAGSGVINAAANQDVFLTDLTNAGAFLVENNTFVHTAGTITNTGSFTLNSAGNSTDLRISAATILTGGGTVTLAQNNASRIAESNSGFRFTNVNNLIQGRGQIGANSIAVTNQATIDANVNVPGATLTLDPIPEAAVADAGPSFRNTGTLQASNGGVLIFTGGGGGAFTNTGGTIQALNGSEVRLTTGAAITGGTITTAGSGVIRANASQDVFLTDLTNAGTFLVDNNTFVHTMGTIFNSGSFTLNSAGNNTDLRLDADTTLDGGGTVTLALNNASRISGSAANLRLTNFNNLIHGRGQIGVNSIAISNRGVIDADQSGLALVLDPGNVAQAFRNHAEGILRASLGGTATLTGGGGGDFTNEGTFEALDGSALTMDANAVLTNNLAGILTGGTYRAISTGGGATVTIRGGNITQIAAATEVELSGSGSIFRVATTPIENTLTTNGGTLRLLDGRAFTMTNALTNSGTVELGGVAKAPATLTSGGPIVNSGQIFGHGSIANPVINTGTVRAANGTLIPAAPITGATGTVRVDPAAALDLSTTGAASSSGFLSHSGTALSLGANNVTVAADYDNAAFGIGNGFNRRANVTGPGQILASAPFTLSTSGPVDFGIVHVGDTVNLSYAVTHNGTPGASPQVRTAIQTSVNGGNITDPRLSGPGVTPSNLAPIASGGSSASQQVTFTPGSGGPLVGQTVHIEPNFDNTTGTDVTITGTAYFLAKPQIVLQSGPATLTAFSPIVFTLDFGMVPQNSGAYSALIGVTNLLQDPVYQDLLSGSFATGAVTNFTLTGFTPFSGLAPGGTTGATVGFSSATTLGTYSNVLFLNPASTNPGGTTNLAPIQLNLTANVVPEPGSALLLTLGGALLASRRRRLG